jgi:NAD(P)-dependent dehydrogenase (short-subunit alcohol dehydrogenase family)
MSTKTTPRIELDGAIVVVTGGARGIDADIARTTAAAIPSCRFAVLDVTSAESWRTFLAEVLESAGHVEVLVNNAGVMPLGSFTD